MKTASFAAALAAAFSLCGCATVFEGTTQDISVVSNPTGASCVIERQGMIIVTIPSTPQTINVPKRKYDLLFRCNKPGYQEATFLNHSGVTAVIAGNIVADVVLTAGLSSVVDSSDGADNKYDSAVNITLLPIQTVVPAATVATTALAPANAPVTPASVPVAPASATVVPASVTRSVVPEKLNLEMTTSTLTSDNLIAARMPDPHGAIVVSVFPRGVADKAGIKINDVIQSFNGHRVSGREELNDYISELAPGIGVNLGVWRNRQMMIIPITQ
jgi:hypothetical protein